MKRLLALSFAALAFGVALPVAAQEEVPVPMMKAPFHLPVFHNDYVTLLNVNVLPGRNTGYHIHQFDQVSVNIGAADMTNQNFGSKDVSKPQRDEIRRATFTDYVKSGSRTHKATNVRPDAVPQHLDFAHRQGEAAHRGVHARRRSTSRR